MENTRKRELAAVGSLGCGGGFMVWGLGRLGGISVDLLGLRVLDSAQMAKRLLRDRGFSLRPTPPTLRSNCWKLVLNCGLV